MLNNEGMWSVMRVVRAESFGGPEVLVPGEAPDPVAGPGEVVVEVAAADVMFLDTRLRSGWGQDFFPVQTPYVPGGSVTGVVSSAGSGVDPAWVGKRVATHTAASGIGGGLPIGGYADKALARDDALVELPAGLDFVRAAALVADGRTAVAIAEYTALQPGEWVLITAAAGGLGTLLIQLAHSAGARVIAAARGASKLALARRLGAEEVVDYDESGWTERVLQATGGEGVAVVFDGAGGPLGRDALGAIASGGRFIGYGNAAGGFADIDPGAAAAQDITVVMLPDLLQADIDWPSAGRRALDEAAAERLEVVVGQTFPLAKAADAHAAIESRIAVGRTILTV
ncbi:zinc-binding dehydrogenase [Nocardia alni]|uniref:zinc-binding dehydrogenase n=1 Tax=Nocardia alni TaxID=2815723 RepID=UPI0027E19725|nr:zinc-binding dehydrogenase [Nocardia alni]